MSSQAPMVEAGPLAERLVQPSPPLGLAADAGCPRMPLSSPCPVVFWPAHQLLVSFLGAPRHDVTLAPTCGGQGETRKWQADGITVDRLRRTKQSFFSVFRITRLYNFCNFVIFLPA